MRWLTRLDVCILQSLSACLREKEEELRVAQAQVQAAQAVAAVPEVVHPPTPVELRKRESQENAPESTIESPPASNQPDKRNETVDHSTSVVTPGAVSESLLLLDQARQDKEEVQELMKSRIQQLTAELVDVREQLLQLHEQVSSAMVLVQTNGDNHCSSYLCDLRAERRVAGIHLRAGRAIMSRAGTELP